MRGRGRRWLVALAVALTLHAACTGDDSDDDSSVITDPAETTESTTSTSSSSTTETTVDPQAELEAEVEAAYLAYLDAYLEIFRSPRPDNPLIDRYTTSAVREVTLDAIARNLVDGTSTRPPSDPADYGATVLDVDVDDDGDGATLESCLTDGTLLVENETGDVLNDTLATLHLKVTLTLEDGFWKLAESTVIERREGRWTCGR